MLQRTWVDTAANEPDEEIIHEICMRLCNRENLIDILNAGGMPSLRVFYKWINQYPEWKKMYHDALEIKMHGLVEETVLIADNVDPKLVKKAELQIKSRQWVAERLGRAQFADPAKGGGNITVNGNLTMNNQSIHQLLTQGTEGDHKVVVS